MKVLLEAILRQVRQNNDELKELSRQVSSLHDEPPQPHETNSDDLCELMHPIEDEVIELGTKDVLRILQISPSTLTRWRSRRVVKFRYLSSNHVAYLFSALYDASKTGKATCKGLSKVHALQRFFLTLNVTIKNRMNEFRPQINPHGIFSAKRACAELGICYKTLRRYRLKGLIRPTNPNNLFRPKFSGKAIIDCWLLLSTL